MTDHSDQQDVQKTSSSRPEQPFERYLEIMARRAKKKEMERDSRTTRFRLFRFRRAVCGLPGLVQVALIATALCLAGVGGWWLAREEEPDDIASPLPPYCLALTDQDLRPALGDVTYVTDTGFDPKEKPSGYWVCRIDGSNGEGVFVQVTSRATDYLSRRDPGLSVMEDRAAIPGAEVTNIPGTDATVVSWHDDEEAVAGWYQGDSAVILSTNDPIDPVTVQATAQALTQAVIARAPQMLAITGYGPTP